MVKKADIGSKRLISIDPTAWAQWVTQDTGITTQGILSSEFQWISRESDILIKANSPTLGDFLILIEIQLRYSKHMPRRMRAYAALAEERYNLPVYPVLITLLPPPENTLIPDRYHTNFMGLIAQQDYHVIKLWEVDAQLAFHPELNALLPFVPIMAGGNNQNAIQEAVRALRQIENLTDFEPLLAFFANFVLDSSLIQQIMRWDMIILEQSSWYNEILNRGRQSGRQEGRKEEAVSLLLKLLHRRIGELSDDLTQAVNKLSVEQLESLGEALFDFSTTADLQRWLAGSP